MVTCQRLYNNELPTAGNVSWGKFIWDSYIPPRRSVLLWKILHKRIATEEEVQRRGIHLASCCRFCFTNSESLDHLFWTCPFAKFLWLDVMCRFGFNAFTRDCFSSFFAWAMSLKPSSQIASLWKVAVATVCDVIWFSRNKRVFEGVSTSFISAKASVWASIKEAGNFKIGIVQNTVEHFTIIRNLGVKGYYKNSPIITEVRWRFPPRGWIKLNIDGFALGSPGLGGCGGIFRTSRGFTKASFSWGLGVCFAFEAELMGFVIAIEKASEWNWSNLWVETDSTYLVHLFNSGVGRIPWRFRNRWLRAVKMASNMNVTISHIYREGNCVADKLASRASSSQNQIWWMGISDNLTPLAYRDHIDLPYFRFS